MQQALDGQEPPQSPRTGPEDSLGRVSDPLIGMTSRPASESKSRLHLVLRPEEELPDLLGNGFFRFRSKGELGKWLASMRPNATAQRYER
jgi:hypothetical protein